MNFGTITEAPCENTAPSSDLRCSDPAFALANPDICPLEPSLIIKPAIALACQLGSVRFKAFIVENGKETDVSASSIFTSSDLTIALVGVRSGNATGLSEGVVSITAKYQAKSAQAELNVLGCTGACNSTVAMEIVLDTSRSMSQAFSSTYATKLAFAKAAASEFAATINTLKDKVGALIFNSAGSTILDSPTADAATVASDIDGVGQTQQLTTFRMAIEAAISELNATVADLKVMVLVSDGEDTTSQYNDGNNPLVPVDAFKAAGGVIICLGIRAHDKGFNLLEAISTGGFFLNAYSSTATDAIGYLKGLRGYICAGNCTPAGDEIIHKGVSNYADFVNWDVIQGVVDILGNGFYDVLPDNGLYVDLRGSPSIGGNFDIPILRSKAAFSLKAGHTYRIAIDLAGNNSVLRTTDTVSVTVSNNTATLLSQQIAIPDYTQPFKTFSFSFSAPAAMDVQIEISQNNDTGTDLSETQSGVLLGRVKFDDTTDLIVLLDDNFDQENPTYIPPRCGLGTKYVGGQYHSGYNCYGDGCLDEPPPVQLSDPLPLPDIESGFTPPTSYSSTKTACATCPGGINMPAGLVPTMTSDTAPSGVASASSSQVPGFEYAAFDGTDTPWVSAGALAQWLRYQFTSAKTVIAYSLKCAPTIVDGGSGILPTAWDLQGSNDGASWTTLDSRSSVSFNSFAAQTKTYGFTNTTAYAYYRINFTAVNRLIGGLAYISVWELTLFGGAESQICKSASADSVVSQGDADSKAYAAALLLAQAALNCVTLYSSTQSYTAKCGHDVDVGSFGQDVTRSATRTSLNSQDEADTEALAAAKADAISALVCTLSNNDQPITILDSVTPPTVADPYPSVKHVSGVTGTVTKVTLSVTKITHFFPKDILMVLRGPTGKTCLIMANSGNAPAANVSLTFDDAGATQPPAAGPLVNGATYKPGSPGSFAQLPPPGPAQPLGTTLAGFNGLNPNGSWSLWVVDDSANFAGTIESWNLTITAS